MPKEINADYLLWERLKKGETTAFNQLYEQYADILFSFGMVYSKDRERVKDCIHDLFFELYKYRKNLSSNDNIRNYLFKSLKRKIQSGQQGKLSLVYTSESSVLNRDIIDDSDDENLQENARRLSVAIRKLPERQQEALNLRFVIGIPYPEVAKIMDISLESVRTLVYRSVKTLREELKENELILFFFLKT